MKIPNQCITETFYDENNSTVLTNFYCFKSNNSNTYKYMNPLNVKYISEGVYSNLLNKVSLNKTRNIRKTKKKAKSNTKQTKKRKQK